MVPKLFFLPVLGFCRDFFQHPAPVAVRHPTFLAPAGLSTAAYVGTAAEQPVTMPFRGADALDTDATTYRPLAVGGSGSVVLAALAILGIAASRSKLPRRNAVGVTRDLAEAAMKREIAMLTISAGEAKFDGRAYAKTLPGVCQPTEFFDPLGFCSDDNITKSKVDYFREAELKHGRVGMVATFGFVVQEACGYHPFFGGNIERAGIDALSEPQLARFWPFIFVLIGGFEAIAALYDYEKIEFGKWSVKKGLTTKADKELGKYGLLVFDPLKLAPKDPAEYKDMQTAELNNGRLGMLAAAGIIAQEMATKEPFTNGLLANFDKIFTLLVAIVGFEMTRFGIEKRWEFVGAKMKAAKAELAGREQKPFNLEEYISKLPGESAPTGYFDPAGFLTGNLTEGQAKYFREAELKHGRLGMLAAVGILVGENYHPFFGGNVDMPAIQQFSAPELQPFWRIAVPAVMLMEVFSLAAFDIQKKGTAPWSQGGFWSVAPWHEPGDYAFDPLDLLPQDPEKRAYRQTQEINNGRLGMLGAGGMIAQEMVTGEKIFDTPNLVPSIVAGAGGLGLVIAASLAFWDLAEDKNAGYQGTESQSRWKFAPQRWTEYQKSLDEPTFADRPAFDGAAYANTLPGIYAAVAPGQQGFWDPLGFCSQPGVTKAKVDFYRDAEMKHGRLGMLASSGILLSETFHPIGGSQVDGEPAIFAIAKTPLPGWFYAVLVLGIGASEAQAMMGSDGPEQRRQWDPLNRSPDAVALRENQDVELAFGRIGMVGAIGMITQELITQSPILSSL
jgi:hypothetical protein